MKKFLLLFLATSFLYSGTQTDRSWRKLDKADVWENHIGQIVIRMKGHAYLVEAYHHFDMCACEKPK